MLARIALALAVPAFSGAPVQVALPQASRAWMVAVDYHFQRPSFVAPAGAISSLRQLGLVSDAGRESLMPLAEALAAQGLKPGTLAGLSHEQAAAALAKAAERAQARVAYDFGKGVAWAEEAGSVKELDARAAQLRAMRASYAHYLDEEGAEIADAALASLAERAQAMRAKAIETGIARVADAWTESREDLSPVAAEARDLGYAHRRRRALGLARAIEDRAAGAPDSVKLAAIAALVRDARTRDFWKDPWTNQYAIRTPEWSRGSRSGAPSASRPPPCRPWPKASRSARPSIMTSHWRRSRRSRRRARASA